MALKLFLFFYKLCQTAQIRMDESVPYKKKCPWALLLGIGKAGMYFFT